MLNVFDFGTLIFITTVLRMRHYEFLPHSLIRLWFYLFFGSKLPLRTKEIESDRRKPDPPEKPILPDSIQCFGSYEPKTYKN